MLAAETVPSRKMAVIVEGSTSLYFPFAGGSIGANGRFEHTILKTLSLIVPVDYRWIAMSGFDESNKFTLLTVGIGGTWYFSQLFLHQKNFCGFFIEGSVGVGYAHQRSGAPHDRNNRGWTFSLVPAVGYSHAFDNGLIFGGGLSMRAHGYTPPISQPLLNVHPLPELSLRLGYAF